MKLMRMEGCELQDYVIETVDGCMMVQREEQPGVDLLFISSFHVYSSPHHSRAVFKHQQKQQTEFRFTSLSIKSWAF